MNAQNKEKSYDWLCGATAVAAGIFAGWIDAHNNEPQPAAAMLLVFGAMMGFARPRQAWRWGVIAALGIPEVYLIRHVLGDQPLHWPQPNIFGSLLALIPALIGVYGGVIARLVIVNNETPPDKGIGKT